MLHRFASKVGPTVGHSQYHPLPQVVLTSSKLNYRLRGKAETNLEESMRKLIVAEHISLDTLFNPPVRLTKIPATTSASVVGQSRTTTTS